MKTKSILAILYIGTSLSCEDFVTISPPKTKIVNDTVFTDDATATSAILGIYSRMMEYPSLGNHNITKFAGLTSDELETMSQQQDQIEFYENDLTINNSNVRNLWASGYQYIYQANAVLESLNKSNGISMVTSKQLEGEAKFIRAFCHFYLVNLWGDIPLLTSTDYRANLLASRIPTNKVYEQIVSDLQDAQNLLTEEYITLERVRPNKYTATALLARVFLYMEDWDDAEAQASSIINSSVYALETDLNAVFSMGSNEAIWQLLPWFIGMNTYDGAQFIPESSVPAFPLNPKLIAAFEVNDKRFSNWVGNITIDSVAYFFPYKYKANHEVPTEYNMVFRLAEQFLVRAEARAQLNKLDEAIQDVDAIRFRAGLGSITQLYPDIDRSQLLIAIEQERRIELFVEWGHRWFDLKRTDRADLILTQEKDNWQSTDVLFPIPQTEMNNAPNLKPQNPGY